MPLEVLIVDDNVTYTRLHSQNIEEVVLGKQSNSQGTHPPLEINKPFVSNYAEAIAALDRTYDLYIIDGQFPKTGAEKKIYSLGAKLVDKIIKAKGSSDGIIFISSNPPQLNAAKILGVKYIINKHGAQVESEWQLNYRDMQDFISKALQDINHPYASRSNYGTISSTASQPAE